MQARAQAQQFLFQRENGFDAGMKHKSKDNNYSFSFFLVLALMLAFALQQVKTEYRSRITHLASENTGSRSPRVVEMILLGPVFASNFIFT